MKIHFEGEHVSSVCGSGNFTTKIPGEVNCARCIRIMAIHGLNKVKSHRIYGRKKPYKHDDIKRLPCFRCGRPSFSQWQVCADGRLYRPVCKECDIELNRLVLRNDRINRLKTNLGRSNITSAICLGIFFKRTVKEVLKREEKRHAHEYSKS